MDSFWLQSEPQIRLGFFAGSLLMMAILEYIFPKRPLQANRRLRWFNNLGIVALNSVLLRILLPIFPVGLAFLVTERSWGLLPALGLSPFVAVIITVIFFDLAIYGQHVLFHHIPFFWRFHRMHHTDRDLDVTSGNRFHPVEILFSMGIKMAFIVVLGLHPLGVLIFEVILNAMAQFNHSNVNIPRGLDRILRWLLVTPDMHRIHHSVLVKETNSNFGFNLSIWDRMFATMRCEPEKGQLGMDIGLKEFRDDRQLTLWYLMSLPFKKYP